MSIPRFAGEQLSFDPPGFLLFGDNLEVLRRHIPDESVDLIYLDPPFNSNRSYNLLFANKDGRKAAAQQKAFDDTWTWDLKSARVYEQVVSEGGPPSALLRGMREIIGTSDMLAYLTMMMPRLVELHRTLKSTGSLYLHCDPTASHYLKLMLDAVFGPERLGGEIIWKRTTAHSDSKQGRALPGRVHDVILFYTKSVQWTWNTIYLPYDQSYVESHYRFIEEETGRRFRKADLTAAKPGGDTSYAWNGRHPYKGRFWAYSKEKMALFEAERRLIYTRTGMPELKRYLDEMPGVPLQDLWTDIDPINARANERLGYPTQKPIALLERIIEVSSNPGDVVLDPFCGCGTTIEAAERMGRQWVGIDITKLAIDVIRGRLADHFPDISYVMGGQPATIEEAQVLADLDKHEFQRWALERIGISKPMKKGADRGIDGEMAGTDEDGKPWRAIVSVKGGGTNVTHLRDLHGTTTRERADIGVLLTLRSPTGPMKREAADAGFTDSGLPRLQILTVADLFDGKKPLVPARRQVQPRVVRPLRLRGRAPLRALPNDVPVEAVAG